MIKSNFFSFSNLIRFVTLAALFLFETTHVHAEGQASAVSSKLNYLIDGLPVKPWALAIGNEKNWHIQLDGNEGKTVGANLVVSPSDDKTKKATKVFWKGRKGIASFAVSGPAIDISSLEKEVVMAFDLKFEKKVKTPLSLHMDCGYPCRGTIPLKKILAEYPTNEWFTLPIPLSWFVQQGTDLTKVDAAFKFETKGKIKMHIANVRLLRIPK